MTQTEKSPAQLVGDEQVAQYVEEGYFVLESVIGPEDLELLHSAAQFSIDRLDSAMDAAGVDRIGINAKGKRYFSNMIYQQRRVYLLQDSPEVIMNADGTAPHGSFEPFLIDGKVAAARS